MTCTHCNQQAEPLHRYRAQEGEKAICQPCVEEHSRKLADELTDEFLGGEL